MAREFLQYLFINSWNNSHRENSQENSQEELSTPSNQYLQKEYLENFKKKFLGESFKEIPYRIPRMIF